MDPENFHVISFFAVNYAYIEHGHVHTYVPSYGSQFTFYQHMAFPVTQVSSETIGIPERNYGNQAVFFKNSFTSVAYGLSGFKMFNLGNGTAQRGHGFNCRQG